MASNPTVCIDGDRDSVPDAVETFVLGLNPHAESTANDQYDDGEKLFGETNCTPGSGTGCGYGALPRSWDLALFSTSLPHWVKAPYDSPFVAALPDPQIDILPGSVTVTAKALIQSEHTSQAGAEHTYGTTETHGTSSSLASTTTWNNWQEVAQTAPGRSASVSNHTFYSVLRPQAVGGKGSTKLPGVTGINADASTTIQGCAAGSLAASLGLFGASGAGASSICNNISAFNGATFKLIDSINLPSINISLPSCIALICNSGKSNVENTFNNCSSSNCPAQGAMPSGRQGTIDQNGRTINNQDRALGGGDTYFAADQADNTHAQATRYYSASYAAPVPLVTTTSGHSVGGAQTTTHTDLEEYSTNQADTKQFSQSWTDVTATDTVHAADLTFSYLLSNTGTDFAREVNGIQYLYRRQSVSCLLVFRRVIRMWKSEWRYSVYEPTSRFDLCDYSHLASYSPDTRSTKADRFGGTHLRCPRKRELWSYGEDQLDYTNATAGGVTFDIDDGNGILHQYIVPTWGQETIQDAMRRLFPTSINAESDIVALSTPNLTIGGWTQHTTNASAWWNLYFTQPSSGDISLKDSYAVPNSTVILRMNQDSDHDGYSDQTERLLGTNPLDPSSHPQPQLVAATHSITVGNVVTTTMSFLNGGNYDAYGIEAVMYAPDSTTTIRDNTIGGNGRVNAGSQVVLGSRVLPPVYPQWHGATPYSSGSYTGNSDKVFTFTALDSGNVGSGSVHIKWDDGQGNTNTIDVGGSYKAPLPTPVADGVNVALDTGVIQAGDVFTVPVQLPRDTFSYTVNTGNQPYTPPVVVASYNDPQGNHKFVTPLQVGDLTTNLAPFASNMEKGVGVDIATSAPLTTTGGNTVSVVATSVDPTPIKDGHVIAEFVRDDGTVVAHQVYTNTFNLGPTVQPVVFNTSSFSPTYQPDHDYTLLAFFTDSGGNIIDSHARLFSTFAADPTPAFSTAMGQWNVGSVLAGSQPQRVLSVANTGLLPLHVTAVGSDPSIQLPAGSTLLTIPPAGTANITATLDTSALSNTVALSISLRSDDPAHPNIVMPVSGSVMPASESAHAFDVLDHPWDERVRVYGNVDQYTPITFTDNIQPDPTTAEPCKVFDASGTTLKGVGKYCTDFGNGTASSQMFGDGRDGDLTVGPEQTFYTDSERTSLTNSATGGQNALSVASTTGFHPGDEILVIQMQGVGAGTYEFATVLGSNPGTSGTITLVKNLMNTYTAGTPNTVQVIRVPRFHNVLVQSGGVLTAHPWDGSTGGIVVLLSTTTLGCQDELRRRRRVRVRWERCALWFWRWV